MIKQNKHIEIVRSNKTYLSSLSQRSCDSILNTLSKHYSRVSVSIVDSKQDLAKIIDKQPDLVFLGMKFVPQDENLGLQDYNRIWLADFLEDNDIPYTGSARSAHELELNKALGKQRVVDRGLRTSPFYTYSQDGKHTAHNSQSPRYPMFVKPIDRGGGLGIDGDSIVSTAPQLADKINTIYNNFGSDALVENYLSGREFSVAILKELGSPGHYIMPLELIAEPDISGARVLSGDTKSSNSEQVIRVTDIKIKEKINNLALNAFFALEGRDYGRIDIRLDEHGIPNFLEANLLPSLISGYGSFPKACVLNLGLGYEHMILCIVELAFARSKHVLTQDEITTTLQPSLVQQFEKRTY